MTETAAKLDATLAELRRRKTSRAGARDMADVGASRARCAGSLASFVREAWPILEPATRYVHGWHVDAICRHLEAVTRGDLLALGWENKLLINVPPGSMKSLLVSVFWPAWEWGPAGMPWLRYLSTSYKEGYAVRDARRMRDLVSSEWYQARWPIRFLRDGEASFENSLRGSREAMPFKSLTGGRGDRVLIDDPHSTETAESPADRETAARIFRESVPSRINSEASAIVVIMQRLHENDVSGQALKLQLGYVHCMIPMEFEPERACVTPVWEGDPRSTAGELMCPERFGRAKVEGFKLMGSYAYAGQYQQRPAPREGGLFRRAWFKPALAVPAGSKWVRKWDLAASTSSGADWTVGALLARDPLGFIYIADVKRHRWTPGEAERQIVETAHEDRAAHGEHVIHLSEDPGQAGKAQSSYLSRALEGFPFVIERETGSKEVRAAPLAAQAEAGNVRMITADWNDAFVDELCVFPMGAHDDQVDASAGAYNQLAQPARLVFMSL